MMTIGSLFSGIGGLELGLEWAGLGPVVWQVELDPFCRAVLAKHWPNVERFDDVTARRRYPPADLLCGGFPCQDVSAAGRGAGLQGKRSSLWWYFAAAVDQVRPRFVVVENVASGARQWLPTVRRHLHVLGYDSTAFKVSAADIGAPHLRKRIFVVAHAHGATLRQQHRGSGGQSRPIEAVARNDGVEGNPSDAHTVRQHARPIDAEMAGAPTPADAGAPRRPRPGSTAHEGWPGSSAEPWRTPGGRLVPVVHGVSGGVAGRERRKRIRALGNAVVPQCAEVIGRIIAAECGL